MILFCGDPHGHFEALFELARRLQPRAMVLLGDNTPPDDATYPALDRLTDVYSIIGNHDGDRDEYLYRYGYLLDRGRDLSGRVLEIDGYRVAGLGGVFRGKLVWVPPNTPRAHSRAELAAHTPRQNRFWGGPARKHWASLWYEDYQTLSRLHADILVSHEAPETLAKGFEALGELARRMKAKRYFHGHLHANYSCRLPRSHCRVEGVALGGVKNAHGVSLVVGRDRPKRLSQALGGELTTAYA